MHDRWLLRRPALLILSLLSACAAANPTTGGSAPRPPGALSVAFGDYLIGRFAESQMDLPRAASALREALAADPSNTHLLRQAFGAALLAGRPDAVALAARLPDNQAAQLVLADAAARAGNWAEAARRFQNLPNAGLTQLTQPLLVAWAEQGAGNTTAAETILQPLASGPRFRGVYALHAAMIADLAGDAAAASRDYAIAEANFGGTNLRLARILASWEARQGNVAKAGHILDGLAGGRGGLAMAVPALKAAMMARPVNSAVDGLAETYLALAASVQQQNGGQFTLMLLRLALSLRPDFTEARLLLANVVDGGRHPAAAMAVLAKVPANDPLQPLVMLRRASLLAREGQTAASRALLEKLAARFPLSAEPYAVLGDLLRERSRFAAAAMAYTQAIDRTPNPGRNDWTLFYDRGIAYDHAGNWTAAEADFKRALALDPSQPYVLNYLGYSWAEKGRHVTQARTMIQRALQLQPGDGAIIDSLGFVMLRQGQTAAAVQTLQKAVQLMPEDATINGHLGDAYWAAGDRLQAQFQWRRALSMNPSPAERVKLLARLQSGPPAHGTN